MSHELESGTPSRENPAEPFGDGDSPNLPEPRAPKATGAEVGVANSAAEDSEIGATSSLRIVRATPGNAEAEISSRRTQPGLPPSRFQRIAVSQLVLWRSEEQGSDDASDLLESLERAPQLQNIVLRRLHGSESKFEVIAGNRRVAAIKQKGWSHVDALVFDHLDDETAELFRLEENLRRRAVDDEATAIARLKELYEQVAPVRHGGDRRSKNFRSSGHRGRKESAAAKISAMNGKSERTTRRKARIGASAIPEVKAALSKRKIRQKDAEELARLEPTKQSARLKDLNAQSATPNEPESLAHVLNALRRAEKSLDGVKHTSLVGLHEVVEVARRVLRTAEALLKEAADER